MAFAPKLIAKTLERQLSRHREFRFRFPLSRGGLIQVEVRARRGGFQARLGLRPGSSDLRTFEQIFLQDFYNLQGLERAPELRAEFARRRVAAPPLILDLGANVGLAALYFAHQWPGAHILAVEPEAGNLRALARNCAAAAAARITAVAGAAAGQDGHVVITNPGAATAGFRTAAAAGAESGAVPAYSIASLAARGRAAGAGAPFLVKIDIEGAERELFSGDLGWLDPLPILIVEPHDWTLPGSAANLLRALAARDRDFLLLGESVVSLARGLDAGEAGK